MTVRGPRIRPFVIDVPDAVIERIYQRVRDYRWEAWTEPDDAGDWRYGPPVRFMRMLCAYWVDHYDWRRQERSMNELSHFLMALDAVDLHFVHERGSGSRPTPLLIAHGWPYSWHSYDGMVEQLAHPERHGGSEEDAFSVVVPSFPGCDFSGRPSAPMGPHAIALVFDRLMAGLGYDRYLVHGGDWGAHITSLLGFHQPGRVIGIHATALCLRENGAEQLSGKTPPDADAEEKAFAAEEYAIWQREGLIPRSMRPSRRSLASPCSTVRLGSPPGSSKPSTHGPIAPRSRSKSCFRSISCWTRSCCTS